MMHLIVNNDWVDADYIEHYTTGYAELKQHVQQYSPEWASEVTGIPVQDIVALTREYATTPPAVIRLGVALEKQAGGGQGIRAICCLPALIGAWRHLGGGILQAPLWPFPIRWEIAHHPEFIRPGTRVVNLWQLGAALTGELLLEPPIKALFIYNSNPVSQSAEQNKTLAGLMRDDLFTVVSEQFMTDTARYADILLPAATQVEHLDLMFSWGHTYVTLNNPAIAPLGEAVANTELFRRLTVKMGFEDECFKLNDEALAMQILDWSASVMQGIDIELLKQKGYAKLKIDLVPHAEGSFPTPSGKCEFMASKPVSSSFVVSAFRQGFEEYGPGQTLPLLPTYIPPKETVQSNPELAQHYPLKLLSTKPHQFLNSCFANLPKHRKLEGEFKVVIHPSDAAKRGIESEQQVKIFNARGTFQAVALVKDITQPGIIVAPLGHWRTFNQNSNTLNAATSSTLQIWDMQQR